MALIQLNKDNIYGLTQTLNSLLEDTSSVLSIVSELEDRIYELEHRTFQQTDTPTESVNEGDIWLDTSDDTIKVYRKYITEDIEEYVWEPLVFKNNDTVDGGYY